MSIPPVQPPTQPLPGVTWDKKIQVTGNRATTEITINNEVYTITYRTKGPLDDNLARNVFEQQMAKIAILGVRYLGGDTKKVSLNLDTNVVEREFAKPHKGQSKRATVLNNFDAEFGAQLEKDHNKHLGKFQNVAVIPPAGQGNPTPKPGEEEKFKYRDEKLQRIHRADELFRAHIRMKSPQQPPAGPQAGAPQPPPQQQPVAQAATPPGELEIFHHGAAAEQQRAAEEIRRRQEEEARQQAELAAKNAADLASSRGVGIPVLGSGKPLPVPGVPVQPPQKPPAATSLQLAPPAEAQTEALRKTAAAAGEDLDDLLNE